VAFPLGQAGTMRDTAIAQMPAASALDEVKQDVRASPHKQKMSKEGQDNVAMCTALAAHSGCDSKMEWVPPRVTQDFSYPSDEEITPNLKASFKKAFLPRLGHVRSRFKGADEVMDSGMSTALDEARTSASCLPITAGKGSLFDGDMALASDTSPRCYIYIVSRLPWNPEDLQHTAGRARAST
jgi:hypothetical protein